MRYSNVETVEYSNGKGIGVSLFVQGCRFMCKNCFNKETWDFNGGTAYTEETEQNILNLMGKSYITRLTILGGEPLADENVETVLGLVQKVRKVYPDKKIWLYTGYTYENIINKMFDAHTKADVLRLEVITTVQIVVDGQFIDEEKDLTLHFRGSANQHVIDVDKTMLNISEVLDEPITKEMVVLYDC